jgi:hypothetical protein
MARTLKKFDFPGAGRPGRRYPFDDWLDGRVWCVEPGVDFDSKPEAFRNYVHKAAKARGLKVHTYIEKETGAVIFEAYTP